MEMKYTFTNIPEGENDLLMEIGRLQIELEKGKERNRNYLDGYTTELLQQRLEQCKIKLNKIHEMNKGVGKILLKG